MFKAQSRRKSGPKTALFNKV